MTRKGPDLLLSGSRPLRTSAQSISIHDFKVFDGPADSSLRLESGPFRVIAAKDPRSVVGRSFQT